MSKIYYNVKEAKYYKHHIEEGWSVWDTYYDEWSDVIMDDYSYLLLTNEEEEEDYFPTDDPPISKMLSFELKELDEELSERIASTWRILIGPGCGYFDSYEVRGDEIHIMYDKPRGGGIGGPDVIPLVCFDMKIDEAEEYFANLKIQEMEKNKKTAEDEIREEELKQLAKLKEKYEKI
jgi:hypothetical protein